MISDINQVWDSAPPNDLVDTLLELQDRAAMKKFIRDVMTEKEIIEISARLQAAMMLNAGEKYTTIVTQTKLSSRTIARISDWIKQGSGGYKLAFERANFHTSHIPPVIAE